ncbi:accessory gene regulator B family protein [uncultured Eubacterium sp.]|uniref:accessory gene regulator B family protein n=1 Tax=uncultured Eubacterium sp. TaxID=165185 RepID=UPI00265D266C|nr:accessory gene regulator B family protein [uncultured Eubacterium sp.]
MKKTTKEIDKMTNMLTNFIIQHSDVKREDADIIAFGVKYGLITLAEILGMVVISFLMRELIPGAVILIAFISIRVYAGGYHAKTLPRCVVMSTILFTLIILGYKMLYLPIIVKGLIALFLGVLILIFSPVENDNRRLSENEKKVFKNRALLFYSISLIIFILIKKLSNILVWAYLMILVVLIGGIVKERMKMTSER